MKVVLIVLDTLRRNHLGCYGYERNTSPRIDGLASEGTVFDRCYATDVPTYPSFTALLSGQLGIKTGRVSFSPTEFITHEVPWMPTLLAAEGITTAAASTLYHMDPYFARGFQYYMNPKAGHRHLTQTVEAEEINEVALSWLGDHYREDFFLFVHYWDPHVESVWGRGAPKYRYEAPPDYKELFYKGKPEDPTDPEYIISQYDANIAYADKQIGRLLDTLSELGIERETLILFITDHGENLGETRPQGKDLWDHYDVYEPIVHLPFIIKHPSEGHGKRIDAMVQNVDLAATIFDYMGLRLPEAFDGRSLLGLVQEESGEGYPEVFAETGFATCKRALVTADGWKLIKSIDNGKFKDAPTTELYDLNRNPEETQNQAEESSSKLQELEYRMYKWLEAQLGQRPDPLKLRAHMGTVNGAKPYYGYIFLPQKYR
jgi:arylsulfatase A-like enzyme